MLIAFCFVAVLMLVQTAAITSAVNRQIQLQQSSNFPNSQAPSTNSQSPDSSIIGVLPQDEREAIKRLQEIKKGKKSFEVGLTRAFVRQVALERIKGTEGEMAPIPDVPADRVRHEANAKFAEFEQKLAGLKSQKQRYFGMGGFAGLFFDEDTIEMARQNARKQSPMPQIKNKNDLILSIPYFDWRLSGFVPAVQDQNQAEDCSNTCWAFAATAAFEARLMFNINKFMIGSIRDKTLPYLQVKLSVQSVLDCVKKQGASTCGGGLHDSAFAYFVENGARILVARERDFKTMVKDPPTDGSQIFIGNSGRCTEKDKNGLKPITWDFLSTSPDQIPTVPEMKIALLQHGPLVVAIKRGPYFTSYKRGVFSVPNPEGTDHVVLLTGWDEKKGAWIIQNSYGNDWGEACLDDLKRARSFMPVNGFITEYLKSQKGCMYVAYNTSNFGKYAAWIEAPYELEPATK